MPRCLRQKLGNDEKSNGKRRREVFLRAKGVDPKNIPFARGERTGGETIVRVL